MSCDPILPKCQAQCCGIAPIPKETWEAQQGKVVTPPHKVMEENGQVFPMTTSLKCCFLTSEHRCNIYEHRPEVCQLFSNESHPMLCCSYIDKTGKERSRQDRRRIERVKEKFIISFSKRHGYGVD